MENFKDLFVESKGLNVNLEVMLDVKKDSAKSIPLRSKVIDNTFNTSEIAELVLSGYYHLTHKYEDYIVSPEDVAKVAGFGELIKNGGGEVKIGRKTFKFQPSVKYGDYHAQIVATKVYKLEISGAEPVDAVVPYKIPASAKKAIQTGPVIYAIKSTLSQEQIDGIYATHDEDFKMGFYVEDYKGGIRIMLMSSFELTKGENFFIYGQQHTSKNEKFVYVNMDKFRYVKLSKRQIQPPKSYSKGLVQDRASGMFVAK